MPNHYMISHSLMSNTHKKKRKKNLKRKKTNKQTNKKEAQKQQKTNKPTQITSLLQTIHNSDHIIIYHSYL